MLTVQSYSYCLNEEEWKIIFPDQEYPEMYKLHYQNMSDQEKKHLDRYYNKDAALEDYKKLAEFRKQKSNVKDQGGVIRCSNINRANMQDPKCNLIRIRKTM
jgi:competence protein ComGF